MLEFLPERITRSKEHSGALRYVLMILRTVEKITNCIIDPCMETSYGRQLSSVPAEIIYYMFVIGNTHSIPSSPPIFDMQSSLPFVE